MSESPDPVLQAIVQSAVDATAAARGWLVVTEGAAARVVAGSGDGTIGLVGRTIDASAGMSGYVTASGQPIALVPRRDDPRLAEGVSGLLDHSPSSVLAVPCASDEDVVGALELIDRAGGGGFTFDDIELATLLAGIAATALGQSSGGSAVPEPQQLAGELSRLAEADPSRYGVVATAVSALLSRA